MLSLTMVAYILSIGLAAGGIHTATADIHLRGGPALATAVVQRSIEELKIAEHANLQAKDSAKAAQAQQLTYGSHVAGAKALETYDKVAALVPEARAGVLKTRMYAMEARQHAAHTSEVESATRHIPEMAAETARAAVKGWIASDAAKVAKGRALSTKEATKLKTDKLAASVAAAAEPYHLALLRNQKFAAETLNKAQTAQQSAVALETKARRMAGTAQQMQAAAMPLDAQSMMSTASGMMTEAENLRQWGNKLYKQANTAQESTGAYTAEAQQAATNAAMTTVVNAPMRLP